MYTIGKRFTFSAAHHLEGLPEGHKCARVHGHTYTVEIILQSTSLVAPGFVVDYGDLLPLRQMIDAAFEHRDLNDSALAAQPTAENLAWFIFEFCHACWPQTIAVRVCESPETWAEYRE